MICFFFNDTATTEIYTLSLHDALPILPQRVDVLSTRRPAKTSANASQNRTTRNSVPTAAASRDRKSTRLNSSHANISYAVFCLKKKNTYNSTSSNLWNC